MSDATGVNNVSGGSLDVEAKKTGKTMEELTEEKQKDLDKKIEKGATGTSIMQSPEEATFCRRTFWHKR